MLAGGPGDSPARSNLQIAAVEVDPALANLQSDDL